MKILIINSSEMLLLPVLVISYRYIGIPLTSWGLRGCVTFLEIVFVGQCEVFVCLDLMHFFPLGHEAHRFTNRVSIP